MGVQVLNKDISVISNIIGRPKANIARIMNVVFSSADVTPNPTPAWANVVDNSNILDGGWTYAIQAIEGIDTKISLQFSPNKITDGTFWYRRDGENPGWTNGQSGLADPSSNGFTSIGSGVTIDAENTNFISFAYRGINFSQTSILTITNLSDNNTILDTISGTYTSP